jgi:hypothetical protein
MFYDLCVVITRLSGIFSGSEYNETSILNVIMSILAYQLFAHGRWFSPGTPTSSTTKTGRHDIAEILLKMA